MRTIEVKVHADGRIEADAIGFQGKGCQEALDKVLAAFGKDRTDTLATQKPELYLDENIEQQL